MNVIDDIVESTVSPEDGADDNDAPAPAPEKDIEICEDTRSSGTCKTAAENDACDNADVSDACSGEVCADDTCDEKDVASVKDGENADVKAEEASADVIAPPIASSHNALGRLFRHKDAEQAAPAQPHKIVITKERVLSEVKFFALLVLLSCLRATFNYMFILPNGFAPGGVGGISNIIYNVALRTLDPHIANTVFEPGLTTFIMNVPLLITAFFVLNKRFTFNTFCVIACYSGFTSLYSSLGDRFPQYLAEGDTGLQIIAALVGGTITGVCLGIMLRNNMSMGGTDIIGKIIHKHNPQAGANWWIMMCDCIIATSSCVLGILNLQGQDVSATKALTTVLSPILFSFLSLAACSVIADVIQSGFQSSLVFTIITDKPSEIGEQIATKLHRGVTISKAVGYYTGVEHEILVCVVSKKQINVVKNIVAEADPMAFTYITKAREVAGKGFRAGS